MHITIKWRESQYPTFQVMLHSSPDAEPFLTLYDCRIVDGSKGPFVSYPARKDEKGKFWNYMYGSDKFNAVLLSKANEARKPPAAPKPPAVRPAQMLSDDDADIPF